MFSLDGVVDEKVCFDESSGFPFADVQTGHPESSPHSQPILFVKCRDCSDIGGNPILQADVHVHTGASAYSRTRRDSKGSKFPQDIDVAEGLFVRGLLSINQNPCVLPVRKEGTLNDLYFGCKIMLRHYGVACKDLEGNGELQESNCAFGHSNVFLSHVCKEQFYSVPPDGVEWEEVDVSIVLLYFHTGLWRSAEVEGLCRLEVRVGFPSFSRRFVVNKSGK